MHPQAQQTFLNYLKFLGQQHQVIVTTHSPIFVDRTQPENVVLLRRITQNEEKKASKLGVVIKAGNTKAVVNDYRTTWAEIKENLGIRLSDVLMMGEVNLLVEGPTEAILLPAMAHCLLQQREVTTSFERIFIVVGDGGYMTNLAKMLQSTGNPILVMVDNDKAGRNVKNQLDKDEGFTHEVLIPNIKSLRVPLNQLDEVEIEDLLDDRALLAAFNEAFSQTNGFEFLPINYDEFVRARDIRLWKKQNFSWVDTMSSLIREKRTQISEKSDKQGEVFSKRTLAEFSAKYIREGKMPVPPFCREVIIKALSLLHN